MNHSIMLHGITDAKVTDKMYETHGREFRCIDLTVVTKDGSITINLFADKDADFRIEVTK